MQKITSILLSFALFLFILPVIIVPPQLSGGPDELIPTRNLLLMGDYPDDISHIPIDEPQGMSVSDPPPVNSSISTAQVSVPVPAGILAAKSVPTPIPVAAAPTDPPLGKGWVQVSLATSIDSPTEMIEDRQRYMASGLFNVHVYHQFAG